MAKIIVYLILVVILTELSNETFQEDLNNDINNSNETEKTLSRKRRYLVFPTGSSLQLVYCLTVPSVGVGQIFTLGETAALAWELPDKADFIYDLIGHKKKTTTAAPETTTLPPLHLDHDYDDDLQHYDHPSERTDKPPNHFSGGWTFLGRKYPGSPVNDMSNPDLLRGVCKKFTVHLKKSSNGRPAYVGEAALFSIRLLTTSYLYRYRPNSSHNNGYFKKINEVKPGTTYIHPVYHQLHRRTRRDLYQKVEKLFTAWRLMETIILLSRDGKACIMKAICEVSQAAQKKGTFMEEIIKVIFRVKPHDEYPDEDDYDTASNKSHNCVDLYPTCESSIWSSMLGP
ncbi:hypothetical protein NQ317_016751 [Molorchus minor]|uniref:Uncharacterized protein n=1 Tax=Molorchus minor TaxID=1323400 RepID=A0ABQ9JNE4_9CUCU|nr:hypothetical protein NQ317_016751 [Molorchus minor]